MLLAEELTLSPTPAPPAVSLTPAQRRAARELLTSLRTAGVVLFRADLVRRGKSDADLAESLDYLRTVIEPVTPELYSTFEGQARERLRDRDESDWPILATAFALTCAVWTEDADFFGAGAAVRTTNRLRSSSGNI